MKRGVSGLFLALLVAFGPPAQASNDTYSSQQWALQRMHVEAAWRASRGDGVVVAVVDTGVDLAHPDLSGRLVAGRDFVEGDDTPQDLNGHGTHMAGSIAAVADNGIGIAGIAPRSRIMPVRVLDENGRTDDPTVVRDGIDWAVDHHADVINLSLAADGPGTPLGGQDLLATAPIDFAIRDAVARGAVVIIAAGNSETGGKSSTSYDATVDGALVVGASTRDDRRAAYSNYGDGLDVVAPGGGSATDPDFQSGCTSSNAIVGLYRDPKTGKSQYAGACGTSVAVAQVSGVAAMLVRKGMTNEQVTDRIMSTSVDVGPVGHDAQTGRGRVDAARALGVSTTVPPPTSNPPTSPTSKARVGAAASATASPSPSQSPSATPAVPSSPPSEGPPRAAGRTPPSSPDRSTPIAVAAALAFFAGWGFLSALERARRLAR